MKTVIVGHFGGTEKFLDGQTVKTKIVATELEKNLIIKKIDTYGGKKGLFKTIFQLFSGIKDSRNFIMLPAHNGIKIFTPLLCILKLLFKKKIHYIVIGGWLADFLQNKKSLKRQLQKFDFIYVETTTMKDALEEQGFTNIVVMPNCKNLKILTEAELVYPKNEPYKFCTFSRVMREKGIEEAIEAVARINEKYNRTVCTLDIYGQVDSTQTKWFDELKMTFPEYVKYIGIVDYDKSVDVLKDYFALLFPTKFYTEGIPGTLIDTYAAGVPVITALWQNSKDVFVEDITGWGYEFENTEMFYSLVKKSIEKTEDFLKMKKTCLEEAEKFMPEKTTEVLIQRLV